MGPDEKKSQPDRCLTFRLTPLDCDKREECQAAREARSNAERERAVSNGLVLSKQFSRFRKRLFDLANVRPAALSAFWTATAFAAHD